MPFFLSVMDGHLFCMKATEVIVPTFSNDDSIFDEYATNQRVRADLSTATFGNEQCPFHVGAVIIVPGFVHNPSKRCEFITACIGPPSKIVKKTRFMRYG